MAGIGKNPENQHTAGGPQTLPPNDQEPPLARHRCSHRLMIGDSRLLIFEVSLKASIPASKLPSTIRAQQSPIIHPCCAAAGEPGDRRPACLGRRASSLSDSSADRRDARLPAQAGSLFSYQTSQHELSGVNGFSPGSRRAAGAHRQSRNCATPLAIRPCSWTHRLTYISPA